MDLYLSYGKSLKYWKLLIRGRLRKIEKELVYSKPLRSRFAQKKKNSFMEAINYLQRCSFSSSVPRFVSASSGNQKRFHIQQGKRNRKVKLIYYLRDGSKIQKLFAFLPRSDSLPSISFTFTSEAHLFHFPISVYLLPFIYMLSP